MTGFASFVDRKPAGSEATPILSIGGWGSSGDGAAGIGEGGIIGLCLYSWVGGPGSMTFGTMGLSAAGVESDPARHRLSGGEAEGAPCQATMGHRVGLRSGSVPKWSPSKSW